METSTAGAVLFAAVISAWISQHRVSVDLEYPESVHLGPQISGTYAPKDCAQIHTLPEWRKCVEGIAGDRVNQQWPDTYTQRPAY